VFTLPNLEFFYSKNVKNKECIHTWVNGTSDTSTTDIETQNGRTKNDLDS
jgi:hypothetical protein